MAMMMMHTVGCGMLQTLTGFLSRNSDHIPPSQSLADSPSEGMHPFLLLISLGAICLCLIMVYRLHSKRRSSKASKTNPGDPFSEEAMRENMPKNLISVGPGEWLRPLGNLETFLEIAGEYGSENTVMALWLSSKEPIKSEDVREAVLEMGKKNEILQVCVEWRGMRPWFKRMKEFVFDYDVIEDDVMSVFYKLLHKTYDMTKGPLWGARFVPIPRKSDDDTHQAALLFTVHHCLTDGHTSFSFSRDTIKYLNASMTGKVYEIPLRQVTAAASDALLSRKDWYYIIKYLWYKMFDAVLRDYNTKLYFQGALVQPKTKLRITKLLRTSLTVEETGSLIRNCKANGVTVHSCIMVCANLALLQTVKRRAKYRIEAARINTANCINMRRYFPSELKDCFGCHISVEEKEMLIPFSATQSKEEFWSLAKVFQKNLSDSVNVHYSPIKNMPLIRPSTILLHLNYLLTRRGRKNRTDSHMMSTNMGNLKNLLPGVYDGPVEITDVLRSVSGDLTGFPFTLVFQTFRDKFTLNVDYYTNKITDDAASEFFNNLVTNIGNIAKYGFLKEPEAIAKETLTTDLQAGMLEEDEQSTNNVERKVTATMKMNGVNEKAINGKVHHN